MQTWLIGWREVGGVRVGMLEGSQTIDSKMRDTLVEKIKSVSSLLYTLNSKTRNKLNCTLGTKVSTTNFTILK